MSTYIGHVPSGYLDGHTITVYNVLCGIDIHDRESKQLEPDDIIRSRINVRT